MASENEPRALTAALAGPVFATRGASGSMRAADRHVDRWAPEGATRSRPLRSLGFVDRLVAPWMETAQRSASSGHERIGDTASWLFPRPCYEDELAWMAAAQQPRSIASMEPAAAARGSVPPTGSPRPELAAPAALPAALYGFAAPSLSSPARRAAYSSLTPLAAVHAAELMSRAVSPLLPSQSGGAAPGRMAPALRNVLTAMLARATSGSGDVVPAPSRGLAMRAPRLVSPPAPRDQAAQLADSYAAQRALIANVQRIAQQAAEREAVARIAERSDPQVESGPQARAPIQRAAESATHRLHEQARAEATAHARADRNPTASHPEAERPTEHRAPAAVVAAIAALPPELATLLGARPDRAMQMIAELGDALRAVELMARSAAAGTAFEPSGGPRLMMPAGLGGLVAAVDRAHSIAARPASLAPSTALGAAAAAAPAGLSHVAWSDRWLARFAGATPQSLDVLDRGAAAASKRMKSFAAGAPNAVFVAPRLTAVAAPGVVRYDDDAETPDDVFASIAAAATRSRTGSVAAPAPTQPSVDREAPRFTAADAVAQATPVAAGVGLSAQLASSPFAAALTHVLPLASAASFDVRALTGSGLVATYLAALLGAESREGAPSPERAPIRWGATYVDGLPGARQSAVGVDAERRATSWASPGMVAESAHGWSVAQERSSSDLALDFVTPELVLAARVYGLGPAQAAQAGRLAIAGPVQLSAMAGTIDRTFVQAMAIESDRRQTAARSHAADRPGEIEGSGALQPGSTQDAAFGVHRSPRGAFLWPSATVAALGLDAAGPDSQQSLSVAAVELLAARAVAELGTYAALSGHAVAPAARGIPGEPGETDVLEAAAAFVPASRRDRFAALYVALNQTSSGRGWSPAARAARALAIAGRGDDAPVSARARAAAAWDVLPVVYGTDGKHRATDGRVAADTRAGLGALSARAGEALSSYVTPMAADSQTTSASESPHATPAMRTAGAPREMVRTGRPQGRYGGGEVEIPSWFEAAARKMLDDRGGGGGDGISMAELTLVTAAPASQIAASTRTAPSAAPPSPGTGSAASQPSKGPDINIEEVANEVYRQILVLMDAARARNGDPYL